MSRMDEFAASLLIVRQAVSASASDRGREVYRCEGGPEEAELAEVFGLVSRLGSLAWRTVFPTGRFGAARRR